MSGCEKLQGSSRKVELVRTEVQSVSQSVGAFNEILKNNQNIRFTAAKRASHVFYVGR